MHHQGAGSVREKCFAQMRQLDDSYKDSITDLPIRNSTTTSVYQCTNHWPLGLFPLASSHLPLPLASCFLLRASCFLLPASSFLLPASCFLLPASCFLLPASCFLLPTSCFLSPDPCPLPPASCPLPPPASFLLPFAKVLVICKVFCLANFVSLFHHCNDN